MATPVQCEHGHYYDSERYSSCPHCANAAGGHGVTVTEPHFDFGGSGGDPGVTVPLYNPGAAGNGDLGPTEPADAPDDGVTVGYFGAGPDDEASYAVSYSDPHNVTVPIIGKGNVERRSYDPVVGWLACLNGKLKGCDFRLKSGKNFIGRDDTNDVVLEGEAKVSRKRHAAVIYDPKQNCFLAQPGESRELFYLNGELVVSACELKGGDRLEVGDVRLMFVPLCGEGFRWDAE